MSWTTALWLPLCMGLGCLLLAAHGSAAGGVFPGKTWREATPESQGLDPTKLAAAVDFLKTHSGADGVDQLVIVRNGYLLWHGHRIDERHGVWSMTKSFTSTVLGLLVDDGRCSLDTRACEHLPALGARYPDLTLRHFTTMTSGYRAMGDEPRGGYTHGPSPTWYLPGQPLFTPPGSRYAYWDSAMNEFAHVLTRIAGEPIEELFRRRIAEPLGMDPAAWDWGEFGRGDSPHINGGSGNHNRHIFISAREVARFGLLFLNRGRWKDAQLLSASWVEQATSVQVAADLPLGHAESGIDGRGVYGLNWWVNGLLPEGQRKWPGAPPGTYAASGFNNNDLFILPEWNMVVARLGLDERGDDRISDATYGAFLQRIGEALTEEAARP